MSQLKKALQLLLFLGIGVLFIWLSVRNLTEEQIDTIFTDMANVFNARGLFFIALSIMMGMLAFWFRALRNKLMLEALGYTPRTSITLYSVTVAYAANLAVPRLGEVLRCTFIQQYDKIPFQKTFGTIVTERIFDLLAWLLILLTAVLLNTEILSNLIIDPEKGISLGTWLSNTWSSLLNQSFLLAGMAIAGLLLIFAMYKTKERWGKIAIFAKISSIFIGIWEGLISIKDLHRPSLFIFYTVALWLCYFLGTYLCFFAFDYLGQLGPMPAFVVLAVSTVAFIIAQGGLGVYPVIVAGVLMLYGVEYTQGLAAGWIGWSSQTLLSLVGGLVSLLLVSLSKRKREISNQEPIEPSK